MLSGRHDCIIRSHGFPAIIPRPGMSKKILFAVLIVLVVVLIAGYYWHRHRSCPSCEGFYWTEWLGGTERENLARHKARREGYDQRKRRKASHFESFGAYGMVDPFGGFPDYEPHPEIECPYRERECRSGFISGAAPCLFAPCGSHDEAADAASAEQRESGMIRSADIYEGFSPWPASQRSTMVSPSEAFETRTVPQRLTQCQATLAMIMIMATMRSAFRSFLLPMASQCASAGWPERIQPREKVADTTLRRVSLRTRRCASRESSRGVGFLLGLRFLLCRIDLL